jgi:hypothetical protein
VTRHGPRSIALALLSVSVIALAIATGPATGDIENAGQNLQAALNFLTASQSSDGTWGDPEGTQFRDTAVVLDTLAILGQTGNAFDQGTAGIAILPARNNDDLARQTSNLANAGQDVSSLAGELLASQNPESSDPASLGYPGRGWGIAPGFGSSTLDTALALRGLQGTGAAGGLSVVGEEVPALRTSPQHPFELPTGATDFWLRVRSVTGNARLHLTLPDSSGVYADVTPGGTPINIGPLPLNPGEWTLSVENQTAAPIVYSAELGFTDPGGFDVFRLTTALSYLGLTQNGDGGWGIAPGGDSHLMVTSEVLRTLATSEGFVGPPGLAAATAWLFSHQNPDGGFSSESGASNVNETALATIAIALADPAADLSGAAAFLAAAQLPNGSWGNDPYQTAIAMQALLLTTPRAAPEVTSNGGAGTGASFISDLSTVTVSGVLPLGVVGISVNNPSASVVVDPEAGTFQITLLLGEGLNSFTVTSVDGFGNPGEQTSIDITLDSTLTGQDLVLDPGLNLIGLRLDPANPTGAIDLLEMLGPNAREVRRLDPSTGLYVTTARSGAGFIGTNFPLDGLDSLIVVSDAAAGTPVEAHIAGSVLPPPNTVDLLTGVNAITVPDPPEDLDAFDLLQLIGDETVVSALQRFDPVSGRFETAVYDAGVPAGVPFPIEAGVSYLASMRADVLGFELPVGIVVEVAITSPADGATITTSPVTVSGTVTGEEPISVIVNGVAASVAAGTFSASVPLTSGPNTIVAVATDAGSRTGSDSISVTFEPVDYSIPLGGTVSGSRIFTAASSVLDQAAFYTESQIGVPAGVVYTTTGVARISATEMRVDFQIDVTPGATPGIHEFQVEYGLLDASSNPLGPLVGNLFEFRIEITP